METAVLTKEYLQLPLEILLAVADNMRDESGEIRYNDFNAFLQVNRVLYSCLNRTLWQSAGEHYYASERAFTHFIRTNNLAGLKTFLELGANVETILPEFNDDDYDSEHDSEHDSHCLYSNGRELLNPTPLLVAASFDDVPLAQLLLEHGADVAQHNPFNVSVSRYSAIHAARSAEMVQLLLNHGADVNQLERGDLGAYLPLNCYIMRGNISAMRVALVNGAAAEMIDMYWAATCCIDAVTVLLEFGADLQGWDVTRDTPLHLAAAAGRIDLVELFMELRPQAIWEENEDGCIPLHSAASEGMVEVVGFLAAVWPDGKEALDKSGRTPLMLCEERAMHTPTAEEIFALLR